ncbi:hypothetical protein [Exiguobacterium acetylicum]
MSPVEYRTQVLKVA